MGSGKTTAIRSLSEIEVVATEAANTERDVVDKPTTTVALDYGEIALGDEDKVRLYGIPGQRRFDFMWSILRERAEGMVLLVNNDAPDPVGLMLQYLDDFIELVVPELRRRGLFRDEYEGTTLREHLGLQRPADAFAGQAREAAE